MRAATALSAIGISLVAAPAFVSASSLQATPIIVELRSPTATTTMTLKNDSKESINAQVRVMRWSQAEGKEKLEPTADFVASPPMTAIGAGSEQTIRLVRVSKAPVGAEESYRVIVDEIPDPAKRKIGQIAIAVRYSIPAFVIPGQPTDAKVTWTIERSAAGAALIATNAGSRRMKVMGLKLKDQSNATVSLGDGLNGYVLARSSMRWTLPATAAKLGSNGPIAISARSDIGPINAQVSTTPAR